MEGRRLPNKLGECVGCCRHQRQIDRGKVRLMDVKISLSLCVCVCVEEETEEREREVAAIVLSHSLFYLPYRNFPATRTASSLSTYMRRGQQSNQAMESSVSPLYHLLTILVCNYSYYLGNSVKA
jgi:hypothetical protein